jgi:hypothetical protein
MFKLGLQPARPHDQEFRFDLVSDPREGAQQ